MNPKFAWKWSGWSIQSETHPCVSSCSRSWCNSLRPESSSHTNIRMRSKCFSLQYKPYYQDERCNLQSSQHFLGNLHSFLNSLDETRLADIKFKRFQQVFNSSNYQRMCISRILVAYKGWINVAEAFLNAYGSTLAFLHI